MNYWFLSAMIALIIYGFWGFFPKLAVMYVRPQSALVYEVAGAMVVGLIFLARLGFRPDIHPKGILYGVLTGVFGMVGTLFYFAAAREGKISVVVSMTALYPLITILLAAIVLREPITLKQGFGMVLAVAAILLFSV
jgi:transporter family protein